LHFAKFRLIALVSPSRKGCSLYPWRSGDGAIIAAAACYLTGLTG